MRLVTYSSARGARAALVVDLQLVDCVDAVQAMGLPALSHHLREILEEGELAMTSLRRVAEHVGGHGGVPGAATTTQVSGARLLAPVPRPGKIIAVGRNYREHARERHEPLPSVPLLFAKLTSAVIGTGADIVRPKGTHQLDYEGELAVVIGRQAKHLEADGAMEAVAGFMCANDVTDRAAQSAEGQWTRAKGMDTFCPLGPELVTRDEVPDYEKLTIRTRVGGRLVQEDVAASMVFPLPELLAYITRTITLEPGDVVLTGTPAGVGSAQEPPLFLDPGDEVEVEIDGLGVLRNLVSSA